MLIALLVACSSRPPIPTELVQQVAPELSKVGHPQADFQSAEVSGWSDGEPADGRRFVDLKIRYLRQSRPSPNVMTVRVYQQSVDPCKISVDVLSDDGPDPILLDNALASSAIGAELCDRLTGSASPR